MVVVHHSGKTGRTYRGSSMLATTFEAIIGLTKEPGADALDASGTVRFNVEWSKFRGRRDASIGDRLVYLKETAGTLRWASETPLDEVLNALATLCRTGRFTTRAEIGAALPEHLWPNAGSPPSAGWISGQFRMAGAKGIIGKAEVDNLLSAARETNDDGGECLHDDL